MAERSRFDILNGKEVEVIIDDFGFTGEGFLRLSDGWLSVPGALPGERLVVRPQPGQNERARRIYADIVEVVEPSIERREPLCAQDAICRGCQLRHVTVAGELAFKVRTIREVMERYAGLAQEDQPEIEVITPQPTARGDAYRIRSRLTYRRLGADFELGLRTPVRDRLIPMDGCPALTSPVQRLITTISGSLRDCQALPWDEEMVRDVADQIRGFDVALGIRGIDVVAPTYGVGLIDVELTAAEEQGRLDAEVDGGIIGRWIKSLAAVLPEQVGVALHSGGYRHIVKEPRRIRVPIGKWQMEVGYEDWFHATVRPAEEVYQRLLRWLDLQEDERMIDVGCGTGTISLMASEKVREVVGVDANRASIEAAEINAIGHERANLRFVAGGWEKALRKLMMAQESFDVATINPMREPLGHHPLAFLQSLGVGRLVYLGPSPEAAARDIGALREMGWTVRRLAAANLHPATYHTLLMAELVAPRR